jgi:hypothetical protein
MKNLILFIYLFMVIRLNANSQIIDSASAVKIMELVFNK